MMDKGHLTRRELIAKGVKIVLAEAAVASVPAVLLADKVFSANEIVQGAASQNQHNQSVVSIVKIKNGRKAYAVEEAIDLLGGISHIAKDKQKVMLKPNLLSENPRVTTKPEIVEALAVQMKRAGKEVMIGEGSTAAWRYNVSFFLKVYRTKKQPLIDSMQQYVFDKLGYTAMARRLDVPLINLHSGEMAEINIPGGLAYKSLLLHHSLSDIDMLCSVPMMKTHALAAVTLGMKNLMGLYPGTVYGTARSLVHSHAADMGSPGVAYETLDMVRANKLGLVVIDGSTAMEGNGPTDGSLVDMNVIIAGTNPLAADMVAAKVMGFEPVEVPLFVCAWKIGMKPAELGEIEIRGEKIENVRRRFVRPKIYHWNDIKLTWGAEEI
jgi:uncharacterized protein (DUF362 family)